MIHLERVPANVCKNRDSYNDEVYQERQRMNLLGLSGVVETKEHVAIYSGNVNCSRCLAWLKANQRIRKLMEEGHK